jgi:transposase
MSPNPDSQREPSREELIALIAAQAAEIAALKARIAELERRLGLNSLNSAPRPDPKPARTIEQAVGRPEGT